jgi:hypothetical protein
VVGGCWHPFLRVGFVKFPGSGVVGYGWAWNLEERGFAPRANARISESRYGAPWGFNLDVGYTPLDSVAQLVFSLGLSETSRYVLLSRATLC